MTLDLSKFTDEELRAELRRRRTQRLGTGEGYYSGWLKPLIPRIRELAHQGLTVPDITRSIQRDGLVKSIRGSVNDNVLACSIRNAMKISDIPITPHAPDIKREARERWKRAHNLRQDGKTFKEIGKILGVSPTRARELVINGGLV